MAKSILTPLNMNSLEIINLRLQNLVTASHPSAVAGEIFYDTTLDAVAVCNNAGTFGPVGYTAITSMSGTLLVGHGGTGLATTTAFGLIAGGTTATGAFQAVATGTSGWLLKSGGNAALPSFAAGAPADVALGNVNNTADSAKPVSTAQQTALDLKANIASPTFTGSVGGVSAAMISGFDTAVRTSRLDQMATPTASVAMGAQKITGLLDPTAAQDAVTKFYVDALSVGLQVHVACRAATTGPITLSAPQTIDTNVSVIAGNRVLVKNQADDKTNGIYVVAAGAWTRATDFDSSSDIVSGAFVFIEEGTANDNSGWVLTTANPITLGSSSLTFVQFSAATPISAGDGLTQTGTVYAVGAGNGISVSADTVLVDTTVVVRKYVASIGGSTSIAVTHNLGTKDVTWSARLVADDTFVDCDAVATSTTVLTLGFAVAPAASSIRVTVHG
jgi:hypothetical protein